MVVSFPVFLVAITAVMPAAGTQASAPPAVQLPLETYPAAMRRAVAAADNDARGRPGDADAAGRLGQVLQAWEQWQPADEAYGRAAALAPSAFRWRYLEGCVLRRLARHDEAVLAFGQAVRLDPTYLPARVKEAEALLDSGRLAESGDRFQSLLGEAAAEPLVRFGLGRIAAAAGRHAEAVAFFERALALAPEWGAAYYAEALSLRALGRREDAALAMARHAQYGNRWPAVDDPLLAATTALRVDGVSELRRAAALAEAGDLAGAAAANEAALALDPSLTPAHQRLISLYGRLGEWAQAEAHYQAAARAGSDVADLHYDHGVLQAMQQQWEQAERSYRQAIEANPLHARAHNNLGQLLERSRGFDAALAEYRLALAATPSFRLARFNAGRALVALGRPQESITELLRITEPRDAEAPKYLFALAVAYVRTGNTREGIVWAHEAKRLAAQYDQVDLAAAIDQQIESLK